MRAPRGLVTRGPQTDQASNESKARFIVLSVTVPKLRLVRATFLAQSATSGITAIFSRFEVT